MSLDTNGDGNISADELEAAGNGNTRSQDPTVESDDSVTGVAAQLVSDMMSALLNKAQAEMDATQQSEDGKVSRAEMFAEMDADGDGKVTQAEFVAGRPDGVSEEDATTLFSQFDSEGTGALTEEQLTSAMEANRPQGPPPSLTAAETDSDSDDSETSMSLTDLLEEMTTIIESYRQYAGDIESEAASSTAV